MTMLFSRCARAWYLLAFMLFVVPAVSCAETANGVGFRSISVRDPVNGGTMPGYVFYPSAQAEGVTWRGPYELAATADASAIPGAKPLVVISHGHGGSALGHHDLATYLASHGFVVATLEHPKDNFHDSDGDGHAVVMAGRPIQVSATITYLLGDSIWEPLIDRDRIGVAGFSNGGYTSLLLVGAVPRFARFIEYCQNSPDDQSICGGADQLKAESGSQGRTIEQAMAKMQSDLTRWGSTKDPRVKGAFVMAPLGLIFSQQGLERIKRPTLLYYAADDQVLRPLHNALHIAPLIPTLAAVKAVPKAGHYVFLAPCTPQLANEVPDLCGDPPGVDRVQVHAEINEAALAFFRKTLAASPH